MSDKQAALDDFVGDAAYDMIHNGEFDGEIKELILKGRFDEAVRKRFNHLRFRGKAIK